MNKSKLIKGINILLLLTVFFFVGRFLFMNYNALKDFEFSIRYDFFAFSLLFVWLWLFISATGFHYIMKKIAQQTTFAENLSVWSTSYLGVYIPGKIGVVAFRILHYKKKGISTAKVSYGFFIEMVLSTLSSVFIVLICSLFSAYSFINYYIIYIVVFFVLLIVLIHPKLISFYARMYFKYVKKTDENYESPYSYAFYLKILALQLIKWVFAGLGIFVLINSVTDLSWEYIPFVTGLYAAAAILGMIAFFAPSGVGVVEGIMIFGLKRILSNSLAGLISIFVRLWKVLGELSFVFFIRLIIRFFCNEYHLPLLGKRYHNDAKDA